MTAAFAALPQARTTIDAPVNNIEQATLETTRVLFFAHDTITDREKRELPFKEFGGIHLPHLATLRDSHYMLYRCRLTQLPPFKMIGDWDMMLPPATRDTWQKSFTQTVVENGAAKQTTVNGFLESKITEEGEFKQRRSNHLVFTKRYPLHEARQALKRFGSHTAGGVVEIEALMGASQAEIDEAQLFFFPEWNEITKGEALLPATTKGLQAHLKSRVDTIASQPWPGEKKAKFYSIGKDMIRSSTEFNRTANEAIRTDEIVSKSAFTKGDTGATTSVISEQYLEQTESRRKEDLITGEHSATKELVSEMQADRKEKAELEAKKLLLEERRQYMDAVRDGFMEKDEAEEIRLGLRKAPDSPPPSPPPPAPIPKGLDYLMAGNDGVSTAPEFLEDSPETVVEDAQETDTNVETVTNGMKSCGKIKANGEPCERQIDALADGCFQHVS